MYKLFVASGFEALAGVGFAKMLGSSSLGDVTVTLAFSIGCALLGVIFIISWLIYGDGGSL